MATLCAPKQWSLTEDETITSFENWKQNLLYTLSLDANFAPYLKDGFTWEKKTVSNPNRGLTDDPPGAQNRVFDSQKVVHLEMMLRQIANYCTVISRNSIIKSSTALANIWQLIRQHLTFRKQVHISSTLHR